MAAPKEVDGRDKPGHDGGMGRVLSDIRTLNIGALQAEIPQALALGAGMMLAHGVSKRMPRA
jgi:hypothetical protein